MRNVILIDIDHTVSHAVVRDHLLGEWDAYHSALIDDKVCTDIANLILACRVAGFYIVGFTARPEKWRGLTQKWMVKHQIEFDELLMRDYDDFRPVGELKLGICKERFGDDLTKEVLLVIDDNEEVIEAFRLEGITCLRCYGRDYND